MSYQFNCTNCGKTGYGSSGSGPAGGTKPPSGWITKWGSTKVYCSNRCKDEYNDRKSGSSGNTGSNDNAENNAELARIEWEKEQAKQKKAAEEQAKLDQKAEVFRSQGKNFCALITEHLKKIQIGVVAALAISFLLFQSNPVLGVLLFIIVLGLIIFGSMKYWKELKS
jgi:hypothetical protein